MENGPSKVLLRADTLAKRIALWGGAFVVLITLWQTVSPFLEFLLPPLLFILSIVAAFIPFKKVMPVDEAQWPYTCVGSMVFCIIGLVIQSLKLTLDLLGRHLELIKSLTELASGDLSAAPSTGPDGFALSSMIMITLWSLAALTWAFAFVVALYRTCNLLQSDF